MTFHIDWKWFILAILILCVLVTTNYLRRKRAGTPVGKVAGNIFISLWRMVRKLIPFGKNKGV